MTTAAGPAPWTERTLDDLRALVKGADVVTLDVFDTLLWRALARPADAFTLAQELVNQRTLRLVVTGAGQARADAEGQLRAEAVARGASADTVTFADIWRRAGALAEYDDELVALLSEMELAAERLLLSPSPVAGELLRVAVEQGTPVELVSDTYLPSAFVSSVLADCGLSGWQRLTVSCEAGAAKADGSVWATVLGRHPGAKVVHIGDNPQSDVVQPRAFGLDARRVPRPADALREGVGPLAALNGSELLAPLDADITLGLVDLQRSLVQSLPGRLAVVTPGAPAAEALGYGALGPLLAGFVQWLHHEAVAAGHDHLFFLARDGHILQRAYQAHLGPEALPSTYLLASRRLCNMAAVGPALTPPDVDFLAQASWPIPVGEYFSRLDVPGLAAAAGAMLADLGVDPAASGGDHVAEVRACFWRLGDLLAERAAEERAALLEYWGGAGLLDARRPAVVDLGWHGSLQRSMQRALALAGHRQPLAGLYFGLHRNRVLPPGLQTMAAFVDEGVPADNPLYRALVRRSVSVIEFCCTRADGTVVGLDRADGGGWGPRCAPDAMGPDDAAVLGALQSGALRFVADLAHVVRDLPPVVARLERQVAAEAMVALLAEPTPLAAEILGRRLHGDGYGVGVTLDRIGAPALDAADYVADPTLLAAEAARASWREGFEVNAAAMGLTVPELGRG